MRQFIAWCAVMFTAVLLAACSGGEEGGGNGKPSANADTAKTRLNLQRDIDVLANDTDPDGDALALTGVTQGALGTVSIVGNVVRYTPNAGQSGPDAFSYSVTDANGGNATGSVSITITTATSNTAPLAVPDIVSTAIGLTSVHDVLANDTDADGDPLLLSIVTPPNNGTASVLPDLRIQYVHTGATTSVDVLEYQIDDGQGGTAHAFVALVINQTLILPGSNDPQAINDSGTLNPGTFLDINVLSNDFNPGGLTLSVASFSQPSLGQGSVTDQGGGVLRYTAIGGAQGSDFFFYTITLPNSIVLAAYVFITINDAPVAADDFYEVDPGQLINLPVLLNDNDPNGDPISITANTTPATGTLLAPVAGVFNYVAASSPHTIATFTYTIEDSLGRSDTATVTIGVSNPPVANNDSGSGGATIDVNVLTNDTDPDMDALSVKSFTQGASGAVTNQGGGVLRYTPNTGFEGLDSFTYVCQDVFLRTASATVSVVVNDFTPPAPISDLTALRSATPDTVTLRWTATGDSGFNGRATSYVIKRGTTPFGAGAFDSMFTVTQSMVPQNSGLVETLTIPLTWYTGTYYFAIKALDEIPNSGAMSNQISVATDVQGQFPTATFDFGGVAFGDTDTTQLQITNQSVYVDLLISSLQVSGDPEYSITVGSVSGPPVRLTPGQAHAFTMQFAPTTVGPRSASVSVQHNAANAVQPFNIALAGNGANVPPTFKCRTEIAAPGATLNLQVDITDGNSNLPTQDDLASATIDLTSFGGGASQPLTLATTLNTKTKRYTASVVTTGAPASVYLLPVFASDVNGNTTQTDVTVILGTGTVRSVGVGQTYATIQDGIDAAVAGDVVLVREGTYTGAGNFQISLLGKLIVVAAEFTPNQCTITHPSGQDGFHLITSGETPATWIVGFRFLNCQMGIHMTVNASPTIANCWFEDCGRGINVRGSQCNPIIRDCYAVNFSPAQTVIDLDPNGQLTTATVTVVGLRAESCNDVIRTVDLNLILQDCEFSSFTGKAVSVQTNLTTPDLTVQRCSFSNPPLSGMAIDVSTNGGTNHLMEDCRFQNAWVSLSVATPGPAAMAVVRNCEFSGVGGVAGNLFLSLNGASSVLENNLFHDTSSARGALAMNPSGTISIKSCTFANCASAQGAAINIGSGSGTGFDVSIRDSIFWNNNASGQGEHIFIGSNGGSTYSFTVENCLLPDGANDIFYGPSTNINAGTYAAGTLGNINTDPLFVNGGGGNFRLQHLAAGQAADSPCIDAGSQTAAAAGLASKTTRTDSVLDAGVLDMGYHYDP